MVCPVALFHWPAGHGEHGEPSLEYVPGWHSVHDVERGDDDCPAGQFAHAACSVALFHCPTGHWTQESAPGAEYVPG